MPSNEQVSLDDQLMPLQQAVLGATGHTPHKSTIVRWTRAGIRGVLLKSWLVGGRRMTSIAEVRAFIALTTATPAQANAKTPNASKALPLEPQQDRRADL